jgi:hypothetical protein
MFEWALDRTLPDASDVLTVTDTYRLGAELPGDVGLGLIGTAVDGCACFVQQPRLSQEELSRHIGSGLLGASSTDLPIRLLEHLAKLKVSAGLMPSTLAGAVLDLRSHVQQFAPDDWDALASWSRRLQVDRVEQYLLGLIADRLLVPPGGGLHP